MPSGVVIMEFLQLRYFYESAKNQSFAKTAEKYMVPLSSVSASVKRLETEIGSPLFDRHYNHIELNENGRKLQNSLCMIFDELDNVIQTITPENKSKTDIKICVRALRNEITDHIIEYVKLHPDESFKTIFGFSDENLDNYDLIIDDNPNKYFGYESFEFSNKRIYLMASSDNVLCGKKLKLKQLWNQPFVSTGENNNTHLMLLRACESEGFTPKFTVQTNDLLCYNKYVEAGIGIGIGRIDNYELVSKNVQILDVEDFIARQTIYIFYKSQMISENVKDFISFMKTKALR